MRLCQDMFIWGRPRGENFLDTGRHFYETYRTKDGKYLALGAIEPQFYSQLVAGLGVTEDELPHIGSDPEGEKARVASIIAQKTRDEWCEIFEPLDACVTPVLEREEAPLHPHNRERGSFAQSANGTVDPVSQPYHSI